MFYGSDRKFPSSDEEGKYRHGGTGVVRRMRQRPSFKGFVSSPPILLRVAGGFRSGQVTWLRQHTSPGSPWPSSRSRHSRR